MHLIAHTVPGTAYINGQAQKNKIVQLLVIFSIFTEMWPT